METLNLPNCGNIATKEEWILGAHFSVESKNKPTKFKIDLNMGQAGILPSHLKKYRLKKLPDSTSLITKSAS